MKNARDARGRPERKASRSAASREKRVRRTPEEARTLILDAAERVFAVHLPDVVGLKEVAREAGVSHALVTHYFGTYAALVEAVLERRFMRVREALVTELAGAFDGTVTVEEMLATYRRAVARTASDAVTVRLGTWSMMSGRTAQPDFISHRMQGLRVLADAMQERTSVPREDLEFCLVTSFALTVMWTIGGHAIAGALGRKRPEGFDAAFEERTAAMIGAYLARGARGAGGAGRA